MSSSRYTLRMHGVTLGHSSLEIREPGTGRARGRFRPALGYELVQPIFRLYAEAVPPGEQPRDEEKLGRYHAARDRLSLELLGPDGRILRTTAIHVADYRDERGPESLEIEALVSDRAFWE